MLTTDLRKTGIFGQKTITGMNSVRIRDLGGCHYVGDIQVRVETCRLANTYGFVGKPDMQAVLIRRRIDRNGLYTHLTTGTDDPEGDLSSVGNQYLFKHSDYFVVTKQVLRGTKVGHIPPERRPRQALL